MKVISQFIVHVCDLMEAEGGALLGVVRAEGRRVHSTATSMALGVTFLLVSVPLLVAGTGLLGAGLMWWLQTQVSRPLAAVLTGMVILAAGGGCLALFRLFASRQHS